MGNWENPPLPSDIKPPSNQGNYLSILIFSVKPFETCIMGANDDLDGKTTLDYRTKMSKTNHSVIVRLLNGGKA